MLRYRDAPPPGTSTAIAPREPTGLNAYRTRWRDALS
jgi:hypothetical protein